MHITLKNSQYGIDKKFYVKFVEGFSGLFCIKITWHYGNLKVKCSFWWYPLKYIQNKWRMKKPSLKLKVFLTKRQRLKLLEIHKIIKNIEFHICSQAPQVSPKKQFLTFVRFLGVISWRIKPKKLLFLVFLVEF